VSIDLHWTDWPKRDPTLDPEGYLYVLEFSMGVIKVGKTNRPRMRAIQHDRAVARFDGSLSRWWLSGIHVGYHANELALMAATDRLGRRLASDEYFADCSFDDVVAIAKSLPAPRATATQRSQAPRLRRAARQAQVVELRASGLTLPQIADELGCGLATVWRDLEEQGIPRTRKTQAVN
jgi:hypothetical protein